MNITDEYKAGDGVVRLIQGDIAADEVAVVVNSVSPALDDVDETTLAAAGADAVAEAKAWVAANGPLETSRVMQTSPGSLPAKALFHTVGPAWKDGYSGENTALEFCYTRALKLAVAEGHRTVSFPAISTGAGGFPADRAAYIVTGTLIREMRETYPGKFDELRIVIGADEELATWAPIFREVAQTMTGTS